MMRSFDCGMPVAIESPTLAMWGICDAVTSVNSPAAGMPYARHPRVSIAFGISRGCVYRSCKITGAESKTDWSPPPPCDQCTTTFVPRSSWSTTSSFAASSRSLTTGRSVALTITASAASSACSRVSARTTATASPANRILSFVSGQCVGILMSSVIGHTIGRLDGKASSRSAAV